MIPPPPESKGSGGMSEPKPGAGVPASADEMAPLKDEVRRLKEQHLRALAELDNARKRLHREKEEVVRYAAESVVRALLPIVDSLDQALVAVDKQSDPTAVIKGVHLIYRQLLGLLEKEGVKRIPTVGEPFDPHKHEAVAQVEATDGAADHTVAEEIQVGYTMHGKVIRPAMVKVAVKTRPETSDKRQETKALNEPTAKDE